MLVATLQLALLGSCSNVVLGGVMTNSPIDDLTEDIEFWTRMTREMSVPTTGRPTRRPTTQPTRQPTSKPTPSHTFDFTTLSPVTPSPTFDSTTLAPVTPSPITFETATSEPTKTPTDSCGLTPEQRAQQFRQMALTVTDESILDDSDSAQARALDWLIKEDAIRPPVCPDGGTCKATQRYIMASFYFATGGGSWDQCNAPEEYTPDAIAVANSQCNRVVTPFPVNNPRIGDASMNAWLTPVNECEWGGVACWGTDDEKNGCMDQIDFENDGLSGSLIPEVHNLEDLRFFILEQGTTTKQIPTQYGLFEKLLIFDLDYNDLTGPIPEELFNMKVLRQLDLNDNRLDGPISPSIRNLKTLSFLQLDNNELSGTIPPELGELKSLRIAFLNGNDLTGVMPDEVCANRNNTSPPGVLGTLVVDCNPPNNPEVECRCCSPCNVAN